MQLLHDANVINHFYDSIYVLKIDIDRYVFLDQQCVYSVLMSAYTFIDESTIQF